MDNLVRAWAIPSPHHRGRRLRPEFGWVRGKGAESTAVVVLWWVAWWLHCGVMAWWLPGGGGGGVVPGAAAVWWWPGGGLNVFLDPTSEFF